MKSFNKIDPLTLDNDPRIVTKFEEPNNPNNFWYLLLDGNHLIMADLGYQQYYKKWLSAQLEFPKQGLVWFCDTIKNKFFKTKAEGGLPKGKFGIDAVIDGEELDIFRAVCAGGPGKPGYTFTTLDRKTSDTNSARSYNLSDELLFEEGLFTVFEDVANKIKQGIL